jgi:CPA2 family monovalent cation:H+ antiporter-2
MTALPDSVVGEAAVNVGDILIGLGVVLLVLAMLGRLAARIGIPSVPLYLIGGLLLGSGGPFPVHVGDEFLSVGAEIGIVLLLLLLGLEYSPQDLRDGMRSTWLAGLVDGLLNGLPGFAAGLLLGWSWTASFLLAGVTYVSSSGIIARLLHDLGRIANRETPIVLSLLVMEDIVMAVFLPIVAVLVVGASLPQGVLAIGVALGAVTLAFAVAFRLGDRVSRAIHSRSSELLILTILGITFLVAGVADAVQVSAAVGAFLLGVTLSGQMADDVRTLLPPFRDVFGGFFFVFFGMRVDPATLPPVLMPALALAALGVATKITTGLFAAARAGMGRRAQWRVAYALVPRGEFSIIIAGLGVAAGVEPQLGPLAAAYVLFLAIVGPIAMRLTDLRRPGLA